MRVPRSWLADFIEIPTTATLDDIADAYVRIGIEPEGTEIVGADLVGPIVVGRVLAFDEEAQSNGKTIRWCQVELADGVTNGIVCGARNFFAGDKVVVSLPGAILPGGFAIAARKTYGHVSNGMICSARELGMGDDHNGIIRLVELGLDPEIGTDAIALLNLRDEVVELNVLPDSGYCMSIRGAARELSHATGWAFTDRALDVTCPEPAGGEITDVSLADPASADHIVLRTVTGFDAAASSPVWMQRRLQLVGVRSISFAVDVTNYVMFELGQPLHAFDRDKLHGNIVVRRAVPGETLETLDHVQRELRQDDVVIADQRGAVALAGTMGGLDTEIDEHSSNIVIEAAHFNATAIGVQSRAHGLVSEASKRFERGVDADVQFAASARAVQLLVEYGGAQYVGAASDDAREALQPIKLAANAPSQLIGYSIAQDQVVTSLQAIGCTVEGEVDLAVTPPSWRPDLTGVAELIEEVARFTGYDNIPAELPSAQGGSGLSTRQRLRRRISRALAYGGMVEVVNYPFVGVADFDALLLPEEDERRDAMRLLNPLNAEAPFMRTTLLAPLLKAAELNVGRGMRDLALYELAMVTFPSLGRSAAPQPGVQGPPSGAELAAIAKALPSQPEHVAGVLVGQRVQSGPASVGRVVNWSDAIAVAQSIAELAGAKLTVTRAEHLPWHPGRCAELRVDDLLVGYAGELHPKVAERFGLTRGSAAFELNLEPLFVREAEPIAAVAVRTFPVALQDLAFITPESVSMEALRTAITLALGDACESVRCFDIYSGANIPEGHRSLAFALRLRASDRTLSENELAELRAAAVAAGVSLGASLR